MVRKAMFLAVLVLAALAYMLFTAMPISKKTLVRPGKIDSDFRNQAVEAPKQNDKVDTRFDDDLIHDTRQSLSSASILEIIQAQADYLPHIEQHYPRALAGDPDSQFLVWSLLKRCYATRSIFESMTFEEIIHQLGNPSPAKIAQFERLSIRCGGLYEVGYDSFPGWRTFVDKAGGAGQAVAMMHLGMEAFVKGDQESAKEILLTGIRTGDPFAMAQMTVLGAMGAIDDIDAAAWLITACTLGVDCAADSNLMMSMCEFSTTCGVAESMDDYLLRELGQHSFDQARSRSSKILDVIQADGFTGLDIEWRTQNTSN